jgi:hypothetical protein
VESFGQRNNGEGKLLVCLEGTVKHPDKRKQRGNRKNNQKRVTKKISYNAPRKKNTVLFRQIIVHSFLALSVL